MVFVHTDNVSWDDQAAAGTDCVQMDIPAGELASGKALAASKGVIVTDGGCSGQQVGSGSVGSFDFLEFSK